MIVFLKFGSKNKLKVFEENIKGKTRDLPGFFQNYQTGFYSLISRKIIIVMYASTDSNSTIPPPSHCKFYGIKIFTKNNVYLFGFIFIELWLGIAIIFAMFGSFLIKDIIGLIIILVTMFFIVFWKMKDIAEIKEFLKTQGDA